MRILGIDHVVLRVAELQRALDFYCGALGCAVERRRDDIGLLQLRAGSALIDLVPVDGALGRSGGPPPGESGRNVDHVCLLVEPFDAAAIAARLRAAGAPVGEVARRYGAVGESDSLYTRDPDGNTIELKAPR